MPIEKPYKYLSGYLRIKEERWVNGELILNLKKLIDIRVYRVGSYVYNLTPPDGVYKQMDLDFNINLFHKNTSILGIFSSIIYMYPYKLKLNCFFAKMTKCMFNFLFFFLLLAQLL